MRIGQQVGEVGGVGARPGERPGCLIQRGHNGVQMDGLICRTYSVGTGLSVVYIACTVKVPLGYCTAVMLVVVSSLEGCGVTCRGNAMQCRAEHLRSLPGI